MEKMEIVIQHGSNSTSRAGTKGRSNAARRYCRQGLIIEVAPRLACYAAAVAVSADGFVNGSHSFDLIALLLGSSHLFGTLVPMRPPSSTLRHIAMLQHTSSTALCLRHCSLKAGGNVLLMLPR